MDSNNKSSDYRHSHLGKGSDYDIALSAGDFNSYMDNVERISLQKIVPKLYPNQIPRYLDFACGTGRITMIMEKLSVNSFGLDVSESMMEQAKNKCELTHFILGDIVDDNIRLDPVNVITAFRFFGNAQDELRHAVLSQLSKLLVTGGHLIINNHRNPCSLHEILLRFKGDFPETDLTYWKLKKMLLAHGFQIKKVIGIGIWACSYRLRSANLVNSRMIRLLEPISRLPLMGPICPDAIIVAQKI